MGHKRALISVSDKSGLDEFVHGLRELGYEIIATGGTHRFLKEHGIESRKVEELTGFDESLRVKTLHPAIYKPLLEGGDEPITLLVCNLYPFEANLEKDLDELIDLIDIGGVSLLRAGAKNYHQVTVVTDPDDYPEVLRRLKEDGGDLSFRRQLAKKAFSYVAYYDSLIAQKYGSGFDRYGALPLSSMKPLRYGENSHQKAWFSIREDLWKRIVIHQGKEISYNNILDAHSAYGCALEFDRPACVVVKHTSPCGVGIGESASEAYTKAHMGDPVSAFGGVVGFNCQVDEETAQALTRIFLEVIIAPAYTQAALDVFKKKKRLRVITCPKDIFGPYAITAALGGILLQEVDRDFNEDWEFVTHRRPSDYEMAALGFAWRVCKWVKSNAIVLAIRDRTVGIGAGQPSRVGAVEIALRKAGTQPVGMVLASDAFFPFRDSIDLIAKAGVGAVIQPGGSIRDQEVIEACNEHEIAMVFTRRRHFRH
ncbi:bifunctional phosphoribosylaminoimidazolecarboxamide formyltransferase/IMP cyclohydrolase PurH [candidate division WOR-3 bacterium]|uniref:Bifunctional purine biosynthesis protein PurH n=1 Tax=candidate division WOR-3 bacterium TaxID=2052148 RepID=A0A660SHL6_UNCW3|nr:MAG: bifunctional phosphoribosylaminoimidazolecarboxamide formyltransferase/IMP cyclohydrolase PurH [candidate division WOR-3 bacterium]